MNFFFFVMTLIFIYLFIYVALSKICYISLWLFLSECFTKTTQSFVYGSCLKAPGYMANVCLTVVLKYSCAEVLNLHVSV